MHTGLIEDLKDIWGRIPGLGITWYDESLALTCGDFGTCASAEFKEAVVSFDEMMNGGPNDAMIARFHAYMDKRFGLHPPDVMVCTHPVAICQLFMRWVDKGVIIVLYQAVFLEFLVTQKQPLLAEYLRLMNNPVHAVLANNLYHQAEALRLTGREPRFLPSLCRYTRAAFVPDKPAPYIVQLSRNGAASAATYQALHADFKNTTTMCKNDLVFRDFVRFSSYKDFEDVSAILYFPYTVSLMSHFEVMSCL